MPRRPDDPKVQTLLAQGTLNSRAQDVRDPAFSGSEFFDPRDLVQVKYEMLRRVRTDGRSVAEAASSFGVSRPTFYKALADFERDGVAGLLPSKRGPHGPHKLTSTVMEFIVKTGDDDPTLDAAVIAERVERDLKVHVHPRSIERALARVKKKRR